MNSARRHYNKWELFESVMTKKPVIEAQVKAEQQLKYPKPGEKGLKPIDGDDEIASNDLSDLRKETIFSFLVSCLLFFDVGVSIR